MLLVLNILSIAIGIVALIKANGVQKENVQLWCRMCEHSEMDLENHKIVSESLDSIMKIIKLGGDK